MNVSLFDKSRQYIPGGVNSPVRAFKSVGMDPIFISAAKGPYIYDTEEKAYIDYVGSWGPMILGHSFPEVTDSIIEAAKKGVSFGACTKAELEMAELICSIMPSIEMVRLVNSGTEATMSALRLARGFTGRDLLIKFRGCYHGHGDSFLIEAGSGALTFGRPSSPGVTKGASADTLLADFNSLDSVSALFEKHGKNIACLIVEPIAGNMGTIPPAPGFLEGLRELCDKNGSLLIFDEVMTGFRVSLTGAQGRYQVTPDLTTMGKIIGGGLPVGAYGGKREIMEQLSPSGPVYQAGTLSGNPLATAAGIATLKALQKPGFYEKLETQAKRWEDDLRSAFEASGLPFWINRVGSMMTVFFTPGPVSSYEDACKSDTEKFAAWFRAMLANGIYLAPSQFEAGFLSSAHTDDILDKTAEAAKKALSQIG
ncbi:MAG: glutamate-1-semialdehyde 2,1-aminomutase [Fibrobacteria bacterium]|nr:glutamate-1-semialdehyde 2,1-aminomutase [Fibrobacteria bacterium]